MGGSKVSSLLDYRTLNPSSQFIFVFLRKQIVGDKQYETTESIVAPASYFGNICNLETLARQIFGNASNWGISQSAMQHIMPKILNTNKLARMHNLKQSNLSECPLRRRPRQPADEHLGAFRPAICTYPNTAFTTQPAHPDPTIH